MCDYKNKKEEKKKRKILKTKEKRFKNKYKKNNAIVNKIRKDILLKSVCIIYYVGIIYYVHVFIFL